MDKRYRKRSSRKTAASGAVFAKDCAKPLCNENRVRENPPETGETGTSAQIRFLNFIINYTIFYIFHNRRIRCEAIYIFLQTFFR